MHTHPNRLDTCVASMTASQQQPSAPFHQLSTFGQSSMSTQSFAPSAPPFGHPVNLTQANSRSDFSNTALGQPFLEQQPALFGQPLNMPLGAGASPFGHQPVSGPFGTPPQNSNNIPNGQMQAPIQSQQHAFGQPQASAFGQTGFGQPPTVGFGSAITQPASSSFGQPQTANGLSNGQFSNPQNPSLSQVQPQHNSGAAFGNIAAEPNIAYGQQQLPSIASNSFNRVGIVPPISKTFGQSPSDGSGVGITPPVAFGSNSSTATLTKAPNDGMVPLNVEAAPPPDVRTYTTRDASNRLLTWRGQPVTYNQVGESFVHISGSLERIWFPNGPPEASINNEDSYLQYTEEAKCVYSFLGQNGVFKDQIMPEIAPKPDWCRWDM